MDRIIQKLCQACGRKNTFDIKILPKEEKKEKKWVQFDSGWFCPDCAQKKCKDFLLEHGYIVLKEYDCEKCTYMIMQKKENFSSSNTPFCTYFKEFLRPYFMRFTVQRYGFSECVKFTIFHGKNSGMNRKKLE